MRFFVDEDLSPRLPAECHAAGYDATCSRDRAMLGATDAEVAALCFEEERVLVTNNAGDFFALAKEAGLHPGLVILPLGSRAEECAWMRSAIVAIGERADRQGVAAGALMINVVVEVGEDGTCELYEYPRDRGPESG